MFRTFMKAVLVSALLASSAQSFATKYTRGHFACGDFEEMERLYKMEPDSINYQAGYASCLLAKGENDFEALRRLHYLADHHEKVSAAFEIARYTETGGEFEHEIDVDNINEAIEAYYKVLFLINLDPRYPNNGHRVYEVAKQMWLQSSYALPFLYNNKFLHGAIGTQHDRLLQSPSYEGDRNIKTYPEYSPYTLDSLDKMIEHGRECQHLPRKNHFEINHYKSITESCRLYADFAEALKPLEQKRLGILNQESCQDLNENNCPEYYEVEKEMTDLFKQHKIDDDEAFRHLHAYQKQQAQDNN